MHSSDRPAMAGGPCLKNGLNTYKILEPATGFYLPNIYTEVYVDNYLVVCYFFRRTQDQCLSISICFWRMLCSLMSVWPKWDFVLRVTYKMHRNCSIALKTYLKTTAIPVQTTTRNVQKQNSVKNHANWWTTVRRIKKRCALFIFFLHFFRYDKYGWRLRIRI